MSHAFHNRLQPGAFVHEGYVGKKVDLFAKKRLLEDGAWEALYPETEIAFQKRVDDQLIPGDGLWQGEFWGKHVLSALNAMQYYGDETLLPKLQRAGEALIATQDDNGYIGTYAKSSFIEGNCWNIWCRKYTLWGLVELYKKTQYEPFLTSAIKFLDHIIKDVGPEGTPIVQTGNFYGLPSTSILQPVVELHKLSGEKAHLDFAYYIVDQWSQHPDGIPNLFKLGLSNTPVHQWFDQPAEWAKGYEFMSCVEGLLELYKLDGNPEYLTAVLNIHQQLSDWEQSFIGSVSFDDKLVGARFFKNTFSEICDNIYWNRLNRSLFLLTGDAKYVEQFEQTFYNGILTGMKPDGTWGIRRQRVSHEHIPATPHCYLSHHQCCTTNLPRGLFQAGELVLTQDDGGIRIALFGDGKGEIVLNNGVKVEIVIKGDYPFQGIITLTILTDDNRPIPLTLRKPSWCNHFSVSSKGKELGISLQEPWVNVAPEWEPGTALIVDLGDPFHMKAFDRDMGGHDQSTIEWHKALWVKRGYFAEDGVKQQSNLTPADPRDEGGAVAFFLGPLALARDVRLGGDVLAPIPSDANCSSAILKPIESPKGIERSYAMILPEKKAEIRLCDYPSAGNTWGRDSCFSTWIALEADTT